MAQNRITVKVDANTKSAEQKFDSMRATMKKTGLAMTAMGAVMIAASFKMVGAAREQEKAMSTLMQLVKNTGASMHGMEAQILSVTGALQKKTGIGDEAQIRVLAKMLPILGDVDHAFAALPAVLDTAAATGKNVTRIAETLAKGLSGTTDMAESLGLKFEKTSDFGVRLEEVLDKVRGAAEANKDPMDALKGALGDVGEKIGAGLLPFVDDLADGITKIAEQLQELNPRLLGTGGLILGFGGVGLTAAGLLLIFTSSVVGAFKSLQILHRTAVVVRFTMHALAASFIGVRLAITGLLGGLGLFAVAWFKNWGNIRDVTFNMVNSIVEFVGSAVNKMMGWLYKAWELMAKVTPGMSGPSGPAPTVDFGFDVAALSKKYDENLQKLYIKPLKKFMFGEEELPMDWAETTMTELQKKKQRVKFAGAGLMLPDPIVYPETEPISVWRQMQAAKAAGAFDLTPPPVGYTTPRMLDLGQRPGVRFVRTEQGGYYEMGGMTESQRRLASIAGNPNRQPVVNNFNLGTVLAEKDLNDLLANINGRIALAGGVQNLLESDR